MSEFIERLRKLMPPPPPTPVGAKLSMIAYEQTPIRRHADVFARVLDLLPADEEEFRAALWVFGEMLCGDMEKRMNAALKLATDAMNYTPAPQVIVNAAKELAK